jgi:Flp pilus assembly pilin Flp
MVALIAVAIVAAVTLLGTTLAGLFGTVTASL